MELCILDYKRHDYFPLVLFLERKSTCLPRKVILMITWAIACDELGRVPALIN